MKVAIKKINISVAEMDKAMKDTESELNSLLKLKHENITKLLGVATSKTAPCILLEYAVGGSLDRLLHGKLLINFLSFNFEIVSDETNYRSKEH